MGIAAQLLSGRSFWYMEPGALRARLEAAAERGDREAGYVLSVMAPARRSGEATPAPPRARKRPVPVRPHAAAPRALAAECPDCFNSPERCTCGPPPVYPGPKPFAAEADRFRPPHAWALAFAPFSPLEFSIAQNSVSAHDRAGAVLLHGGIGGEARGQFAFNIGRRLDALKVAGARAVLLDVRSEGGDVAEGLAVIRMLKRASREIGPTVAWISSFANSMASVIAVSCDYALMAPDATMQLHEVSGGRDDHREILQREVLDIYAARTLADRAKLAGYLAGAVRLDALQAHSHGFVDEVAGPERAEEVARAAASGGLWAGPIVAAKSWRRTVLRERAADASGVVRYPVPVR